MTDLANPVAEIDNQTFERLMRDRFPDELVTVTGTEPFGDGHSGFTYAFQARIGARDRHLVARLSPPGARIVGPSDVGRQGRVMDALHVAGLPTPEVLLADSSGLVMGRAVVVMERVEGSSWEAAKAAFGDRAVAEEAVVVLHQLRQVPISDTGLAQELPTDNAGEVARWRQLTARCPEWLVPPAEALADQLTRNAPALSKTGLVHGDFHYGNLLFRDQNVISVFDWEIAALGDPLIDFGCLAVASLRRKYAPEPNPTGKIAVDLPTLAAIYGVDPELAAWHVAASCFKYAVILGYNLQLHLRGKRIDPMYEQLHTTMRDLLADGQLILHSGLTGF